MKNYNIDFIDMAEGFKLAYLDNKSLSKQTKFKKLDELSDISLDSLFHLSNDYTKLVVIKRRYSKEEPKYPIARRIIVEYLDKKKTNKSNL